MNISKEEHLMYEVMRAVYESGIPINFKGSMVLKACLLEAGYSEEVRHTVDIDANWYSDTAPTERQMVNSIQQALEKGGINLHVNVYRMYGEGRSAGFELRDPATGDILFSMDVDVNRPAVSTKIYEVAGLRFLGVVPAQMIADKAFAISTDTIFRRIKDVVDLYYLSQVFDLNASEIQKMWAAGERKPGPFDGFLNRYDDLKHSYDKFRFSGDVNKPEFEEVYSIVKQFISELLPK